MGGAIEETLDESGSGMYPHDRLWIKGRNTPIQSLLGGVGRDRARLRSVIGIKVIGLNA